jgi:hypothetical protein
MKSIIILSVLAFVGRASAISTKKCPSELKIEFKNFSQSGEIFPSKGNPNLPFAYIALSDSNPRMQYSETLNLMSAENAVCNYRGDKISSAVIEGSLKKGAKNPAGIKSYFGHTYKGLNFDYVAYSPVKSISEDKTVLLSSAKSEIYYRGQDCNYGDCIPNYFKVGSAFTNLLHEPVLSCFGVEKVQSILSDYLQSNWDGSEYVFQGDLDDEDVYTYNLYELKEIKRYTQTLIWDGSNYRGDSMYNYECAASAYCWGGFDVSCSGEISEWQEGED